MSDLAVPCFYGCGRMLDPNDRFVYRRVVGWERKAGVPTRRGGSDITLREPLEEFACRICIDRIKDGTSPAQEALL